MNKVEYFVVTDAGLSAYDFQESAERHALAVTHRGQHAMIFRGIAISEVVCPESEPSLEPVEH